MSDSRSPREAIDQGTIKAGHNLWIVASLILLVQLAENLSVTGIPVLYPFIQTEFALSRAQVGLITSALSIGGAITVVLAGSLTDSLGVKRMITICLISLTVCMVAFPLAYSWPLILALAVLTGIAATPGYPASTRAIMDWFPGRILASAMALNRRVSRLGAPSPPPCCRHSV